MDIILIAGLWLPSSVWDDVGVELERLGHRPVAVALPGADDASRTATLQEQVDAVLAAVDAAEHPVVVGHSAAASLAWIAADRRPDDVAAVVLVGGMPTSSGQPYAAFFDLVDGVMAFPGWGPFEGPDADDLDAAARGRFEALTVPVPGGVATGTVELSDPRRHQVPVVMVCPEYSPEDAAAWIEAGDIPELTDAQVRLVDIDSGHWPMLTAPVALAALLADVAAPA